LIPLLVLKTFATEFLKISRGQLIRIYETKA